MRTVIRTGNKTNALLVVVGAALCLMLLLSTVGILFARTSPTEQDVVVVTVKTPLPAAHPIPIVATVGSSFTVTLASNHTTGYSWRLASKPGAVVKEGGSTYNSPNTGMVGQGGTEIWSFRAVAKGKTSIALEYVRPWEKNKPPARKQAFAVEVR